MAERLEGRSRNPSRGDRSLDERARPQRSLPLVAATAAIALALGGAGGWMARAVGAMTVAEGVERELARLGHEQDSLRATFVVYGQGSGQGCGALLEQAVADRQQCAKTTVTVAADRRAAQLDLASALDREHFANAKLKSATELAARTEAELRTANQRTEAANMELARMKELAAEQDARLRKLGAAVQSLCDATHGKSAACREVKP